MMRERRRMVLGLSGFFMAGTVAATLAAAQNANQPPTKKDKKLAMGEKEAKKLLLLMDKDKNGKVSKQEFMSFMEAEFERLDTDKNGELDVEELTHSRVRTTSGISR